MAVADIPALSEEQAALVELLASSQADNRELRARLEGVEKLNEVLAREVEAWQGQAAALTQTLAEAQQKLIEARASDVPPAGDVGADPGRAETGKRRRWWEFWK
jgi:hypothetical protein